MKKYIKYILCSLLFCFPYITLAKVTCSNGDYSATINLSKSNINLNEKVNITISSDYKYEVEYKSNNQNIITVSEDGIITPVSVGSAKVNVIVEFLEEDTKISECTSVLDVNVLSSDSSLKMLNLEELDISTVFNSNTYEYEVKLPYSYEKINIIAEANDPSATITGDGRRYLNEGTNEYEVIVKATDGTSTTYKIKILREDANDDASLKNLIVEGYVLSPKFNSESLEYTLNVDKDVEDITISAEPTYELAKVLGTGNFKLATGDNTFYITVIAENNTEQKYTIIINKNKGNSKLSKLEVKGYELDKEFNENDYIYNITVNSDVEKLDIITEAIDNDQVEIIGNDKLEVGENSVIIRVSNEDKGATTYKILVTKLTTEEQEIIEKNDNLLKILLVIFIIAIVVMFVLIIIFIKRNYKKKDNLLRTKKIKKNKKNKKK